MKKDYTAWLRLWSLEERRNRQDLIEVFKMCNGLSRLKLNELFTLDDNNSLGLLEDILGNLLNFGVHGVTRCI